MGENTGLYNCETPGCRNRFKQEAKPYITKRIKEVGPGEHQPVWHCDEHVPAATVNALNWRQDP